MAENKKAIFVDPALTLGHDDRAVAFYEACRGELENLVETVPLKNSARLQNANPDADDVVLFFNRSDTTYAPELLGLLRRARENRSQIVPIAITREHRLPPEVVSSCQGSDVVALLRQRNDERSVDVTGQLAQRSLPDSGDRTVAQALARTIAAMLQPTLAKDRMRYFISHRRNDGEELAAALYARLNARRLHAFQDVNDVKPGEDAQPVIEGNLAAADAVVFLDTPEVGGSDWVMRELRGALALSLPIVWIRFGPDENRKPLPVCPGSAPHLRFPDLDSHRADEALVDKIIETAFAITWQAATRVYGYISSLKAIAGGREDGVTQVDPLGLIYRVRSRRTDGRYPERDRTHLVQFYGWRPGEDEREQLQQRLRALEYIPPHRHGPHYDAAILLSPFPTLPPPRVAAPGDVVVDAAEEYLRTLSAQRPREGGEGRGKALIISGAFPEGISPQHAQLLTSAVHAFAQAALDAGMAVVFGAHPTFQPLLFDMARRRRQADFQSALRMYVSREYVSEEDVKRFRESATVFPTDKLGTAGESLTLMREAMIADEQAVGLVALGGRPPRPDRRAGVDEEVDLACGRQKAVHHVRRDNLPAFIVGAPGGRAAARADEEKGAGWVRGLNSLTPEQNEELRTSLDFGRLAEMVLRSVGVAVP